MIKKSARSAFRNLLESLMLSLRTGQILQHRPTIPDMAGQSLIGQSKLPNGDGRGAAVHVAPPDSFSMRLRQPDQCLLNQHRIDQVAGRSELRCVPLPRMGAVLAKHGADGRWGPGRNPARPIEQPLMDGLMFGVDVMEVGSAALTHRTVLP